MLIRNDAGQARRFDLLIEGVGVIDAETAPLAGIAAALLRLAESSRVSAPRNNAGRSRLRQAVLAERRRQAAGSLRAKVRGAAVSVAAVAGAGILVAGAATGTDPVSLVRDTVAELPGALPHNQPALQAIVLEGTIVSVDEQAGTIEVLANDEQMTIDLSGGVSVRDERGEERPAAVLGVGDEARVTGNVSKRNAEVAADEVAITGNSAKPTASPSVATTAAVTDPKPVEPPVSSTPLATGATGGDPTKEPTARPEPTRTETPVPTSTPVATTTPAPSESASEVANESSTGLSPGAARKITDN